MKSERQLNSLKSKPKKEIHVSKDILQTNENKKKKYLINAWNPSQIQKRIDEIVSEFNKSKTDTSYELSKPRKKLLAARLARLKRALNGVGSVGGQLAKKITIARRSAQCPFKSEWEKNKKKECLCCRKKGHTLQECKYNPALQNDVCKNTDNSSSFSASSQKPICFNCGESSHTLKNCPKKRLPDRSLPFALCFLCSEKGHLAQQCPRNTTGIYPRGGGCHICNSLYHLMRDCPNRNIAGNQDNNSQNSVHHHSTFLQNKHVSQDEENDTYWQS